VRERRLGTGLVLQALQQQPGLPRLAVRNVVRREQLGRDICWTHCSSSADCDKYGPAATCQSVTTVGGTSVLLCVG